MRGGRAVTIPALAVLAMLTMTCRPAAAHEVRPTNMQAFGGQEIPFISSGNVHFVRNFPDTLAISGVFSKSAPYFYVSSMDSVNVFDTRDPLNPKLVGSLPNLLFENEAMTYGERRVGNRTERFVLVGVDPFNVNLPVNPEYRPNPQFGSRSVYIVDVTEPTRPHIRSLAATSTSTHTVRCIDDGCHFAYTAGDDDQFSVLDFRNLDKPDELKTVKSPAAMGDFAAGHHWSLDDSGIAWHTGGGGMAAFDVSDPANPVLLNGTDAQGTSTPWNDFILHNSFRPNSKRFQNDPGAAPSIEAGNVVLVTEEDYLQNGQELACERAGSFETWYLPSLDPVAERSMNPEGVQDRGSIHPLDRINPALEGDGGSLPVAGFCSAHWFDYHESGVVALAQYQQGLRIVDVRDPMHLKQYGFFTTVATEVWDAYWVPKRDSSGVDTGENSNVIYTADLIRGVDVFTVDLPESTPGSGSASAAGGGPMSGGVAAGAVAGSDADRGQLPATGLSPWLPTTGVLCAAVVATLTVFRRRRRV